MIDWWSGKAHQNSGKHPKKVFQNKSFLPIVAVTPVSRFSKTNFPFCEYLINISELKAIT